MFLNRNSLNRSIQLLYLGVHFTMLNSLGQNDSLEMTKLYPIPSLNCLDKMLTISQILNSVVHPEDILIVTDCIAGFSSSNITLFSQVSIAILTSPMNTSSTTPSINWKSKSFRHENGKPFIIMDFSERVLEHQKSTAMRNDSRLAQETQITTKSISNASVLLNSLLQHYHHHHPGTIWKPTILLLLTSKLYPIPSNPANIHLYHRAILERLTQNVSLQFDSNLFPIFIEDQQESGCRSIKKISAWEVYDIKRKRIISLVRGDLLQHHSLLSLEAFATRRKNFHLEKLTASAKESVDSDWGELRMRQDDGSYYLKQGYIAVIYLELRLLLNFSESIVIGDSPVVLPNGTLSGRTLEQLKNDEADFSLNKLSLNPQRANGLAFLHPTHKSLPFVFFKQPPPNSIRDNVTGPFKPELWMALLGMWILLGISLKSRLLFKLDPPSGGNRLSKMMMPRVNWDGDGEDERFAREGLLWSVCAICQKSWYLDPKSFSLRMQFMFGSLMALIVYTAYSTFIVSTLAVSSIPVNNFLDLIESNFVFSVHELSQPFQNLLESIIKMNNLKQPILKVSTVDEISHLFQTLPPSIISSGVGSQSAMSSTRKAFLSYADLFYQVAADYNYSSTFMCHHIASFKIDVGFNLRKSALVVKKGAQFKEILNYMLVFLINYGLTFRNDEIYSSKNILKCSPEEQIVRVDSAEFSDVSIIVVLLFVGALLAFTVLFMELTVHHCQVRSSKTNKLTFGYFK